MTRTLLSLAVLLAVATAPSGCSSCKSSSEAAPAARDAQSAAAVEPPVPAPDGLVGDVYVTSPNDFWKRVQGGIGGAAALLPDTFSGLMCALAGLDPSLVHEIDGAAPAFAAFGEGGPTPPFAVAMKLADASHFAQRLFEGDAAAFVSKDVGGMQMLVSHGSPLSFAVAVSRAGYLVVASNEGDLARFGPYVVRTMPTRPRPPSDLEVDVPRSAFAGPLRARATGAWNDARQWLLDRDADERSKHGGRAPDFADASGIVACAAALVERRTAVLADLESAVVRVDALDDGLAVEATLHPVAGDGAASKWFSAMHPGDTAPLLDAPSDALLAWLFRDSPADRMSDSSEIGDCIAGALGKRLGDDDAKHLRAALDGWAKGRGDWVTGAVRIVGGAGVVLRAPTADEAALKEALDTFGALAKRPFFADPLGKVFFASQPTTTSADAPPLGRATVVSFTRAPPDAAKIPTKVKLPPPPPVGGAWFVGAPESYVAMGESPLASLEAGARPPAKLDARAAKSLGALGPNVVFALVGRSTSVAGGAGAPLVVGWGARAGAGWGRVELGYPLARDFVRAGLGF